MTIHSHQPWMTIEPASTGSEPPSPPVEPEKSSPVDEKDTVEYWKAHSREWEKRAKDNHAAVKEAESLRQQNSELESKISALEVEKNQREWKEQAAKEHNVPASLLRGSTQEEINQHATELAEALHPKPQGAGIPDPGKTPDKPAKQDAQRSYVHQLFGDK